MQLSDYIKTHKYQTFKRNEDLFNERSTGVFHNAVIKRIKLELMGVSDVQGSTVLSGWDNGRASYTPISTLIVPSSVLSSATSAYITYATNGTVLFNGEPNVYYLEKVKEVLKLQSVGGSCLLKKVKYDGAEYINIYNPISYFVNQNEYIQDIIDSYTIFTKVDETDSEEIFILEEHFPTQIIYSKVAIHKRDNTEKQMELEEGDFEGLQRSDDNLFAFEIITEAQVIEVSNLCFNGASDYTDDNVVREENLTVNYTINSQTFDKIQNPILTMPEEALEYDENGNARVNLQDRVIIVRDGGNKPEQLKIESVIEQAQIHKQNLEDGIYTSLAVNKTALGLTDVSQLSGEALKRMMQNTIARVEEKRSAVKVAFEKLLGIEIEFDEVVLSSFSETVATVRQAKDGGFMSTEKAVKLIGGDDEEVATVKKEDEEQMNNFGGFVSEETV